MTWKTLVVGLDNTDIDREVWGERLLRNRGFVSDEDLLTRRRQIENAAKTRLAELLAEGVLNGVEYSVVLEQGDASRLIPTLEKRESTS